MTDLAQELQPHVMAMELLTEVIDLPGVHAERSKSVVVPLRL